MKLVQIEFRVVCIQVAFCWPTCCRKVVHLLTVLRNTTEFHSQISSPVTLKSRMSLVNKISYESSAATTSLDDDDSVKQKFWWSLKTAVWLSTLRMLQLQTFLCCFPLETGVFVIGWTGLILSIVAFVIEFFLAIFCAFFDSGIDLDDNRLGEWILKIKEKLKKLRDFSCRRVSGVCHVANHYPRHRVLSLRRWNNGSK